MKSALMTIFGKWNLNDIVNLIVFSILTYMFLSYKLDTVFLIGPCFILAGFVFTAGTKLEKKNNDDIIAVSEMFILSGFCFMVNYMSSKVFATMQYDYIFWGVTSILFALSFKRLLELLVDM